MANTLTIGDDFIKTSTVKDATSGAAWNVSTATEIKATIVSADYKTQYCDAITQSSGATGADWANGIVVINIPAATTAQITSHIEGKAPAIIEMQITIAGQKETVRDAIIVLQGHIA